MGVHPPPPWESILYHSKTMYAGGVSDGLTEMDLLKFTDAHFTALNWPTGGLGTPGHAWHHSIMKN